MWIQPQTWKRKGKNTIKKRKNKQIACVWVWFVYDTCYHIFSRFSNNSVARVLCIPGHVLRLKNIFINSSRDSFGFKCWSVSWWSHIILCCFLCCDHFQEEFLDFFVHLLYHSAVFMSLWLGVWEIFVKLNQIIWFLIVFVKNSFLCLMIHKGYLHFAYLLTWDNLQFFSNFIVWNHYNG